jgi:hypothetical protein
MNNLAAVPSHQGKCKKAEEMHGWTWTLKETVLGKGHPSTLTSMNNLATVLGDQGKHEEAEDMYRRTLILCKTILGAEHPHTLSSRDSPVAALVLKTRSIRWKELY